MLIVTQTTAFNRGKLHTLDRGGRGIDSLLSKYERIFCVQLNKERFLLKFFKYFSYEGILKLKKFYIAGLYCI